jgi:DNA replication protein DnaC
MRDLLVELKQLRLHGMALAWSELVEQGANAGLDTSRWLLEHLLEAELTDRAMRSVSHQMHAAKFPVHRDLAGFDFSASPVDRKLIQQLADLAFTEPAHNAVLVGGPGTGKTHLATAIGVSGITRHGKRVRFYSTVDLVNALEQEKAHGRAGRIANSLLRMDLVILDELGYLPFSQAGGALLFHLLSRLYEHTSVLMPPTLCGAPHNRFNAVYFILLRPAQAAQKQPWPQRVLSWPEYSANNIFRLATGFEGVTISEYFEAPEESAPFARVLPANRLKRLPSGY